LLDLYKAVGNERTLAGLWTAIIRRQKKKGHPDSIVVPMVPTM
jgi:hypothetical protein